MAVVRWRGDAPAVAQVLAIVPQNVEVGDRFVLTINGKTVGYTAAAATASDVIAGLAAAVTSSPFPEFQELFAAAEPTRLTLSARTPGKPFALATSTVNGGGSNTQSLQVTTLVASSGPGHWDSPANWSTGTAPANGDVVYLENSADLIRYGLDQAGIALASLHVAASFTGEIGLASQNNDGQPYAEYRPRRLTIAAAVVEIGDGPGEGSGRIQLDTQSAATAIHVAATGLPAEPFLPAVQWIGSHSTNSLSVSGGSVGVAMEGGTTATLGSLRATGGEVRCGAGVQLAQAHCSGQAVLELACGAGSLHQSGGRTLLTGTAGVDSLLLTGGRCDYASSGTLAAAELDGADAELDFSRDPRPRTVSACQLVRGLLSDPQRTVVWASGIQPAGLVRGDA